MTYVIESPFGGRLFGRLQPWQTDDLGRFCDALGVMFDVVQEVAEEQGTDGEDGYVPGYGTIFDPDLCSGPWLPYLGRLVGVPFPQGASEVEARALIKGESGWSRGKVEAIEAALDRTLPPGVSFVILERTNVDGEEDAYQMVIAVVGLSGGGTWAEATETWAEAKGSWASERPINVAEVAVEAVKPVIRINWIVGTGATWFDDSGTWAAAKGTWAESLFLSE